MRSQSIIGSEATAGEKGCWKIKASEAPEKLRQPVAARCETKLCATVSSDALRAGDGSGSVPEGLRTGLVVRSWRWHRSDAVRRRRRFDAIIINWHLAGGLV